MMSSNTQILQISTMLFIGATTILLFWYLQFLWKRRHMYRVSRKMQGPVGLPLIGVGLELAGNSADIFGKIEQWFNKYPKIMALWIGPILVYGISEPQYMEIILPRCLRKGWAYTHFETVVGHGLLTAPVDKWRKHRKSIMPTFKQKILDEFVEIFKKQSDGLIEQMEKFNGKGEFDLFRLICNFSVDSVCENIMGLEYNAQSSECLYGHWIETLTNIVFKKLCSVLYQSDTIFNLFSPDAKVMKDCKKKALTFTDQIIQERKQAYEESKQQKLLNNEEYRESETKKTILLDYFIEMVDKETGSFTDEEVRDEVTTLIIASSDTSATAVCFTLTLLGLHQDVQAKIYDELMEVVGPNRDIESSDLPHLKYMEMVMKESLRLFPPIPLIVRAIDEDVDLGDCIIPGGANVVFSIRKVHTDERYWPNPYKFIPERFLPEEVTKRPPCSFIPFSYGVRNCIGYRYAIISTKIVLAKIILKYKLSTSYKSVEDIKVSCGLMLRPEEGFKVLLESR